MTGCNGATFVLILSLCLLAHAVAGGSSEEEYLKRLNSSSPSGIALVRSTESMLSTILDKVYVSSNGSHKLRLYVLGDSVTRMMVSNWMLRWAGQHATNSLQSKSATEIKNLCNKRAAFEDRSLPPCMFETEKMKASFSWVQWFSVPNPLPKGVEHFQAVDSCFDQHSLLDCLTKTYEESTAHDLTLIRMGLEYILYASEAFAPHSCDGHSPSCYLPQWETEIRAHAADFVRTVRDVFKGTVVFLLISPFGRTRGCHAPLSEVDKLIPKVNEVLRSIYIEEDVLFIDPYEMCVPFVNTHVQHRIGTHFNILESSWYGYFDCAHYAEPLTSLVLNRFLSTVIRQLPSEHLL